LSEVPSSSEVPPSSTPAAPGGSAPEPPLAATGASPMWLLLSGLGLVGAGAGTLLFLRRRSA
jgi:LPXTG-motif cell wall-anchored protein